MSKTHFNRLPPIARVAPRGPKRAGGGWRDEPQGRRRSTCVHASPCPAQATCRAWQTTTVVLKVDRGKHRRPPVHEGDAITACALRSQMWLRPRLALTSPAIETRSRPYCLGENVFHPSPGGDSLPSRLSASQQHHSYTPASCFRTPAPPRCPPDSSS